MLKVFYFFVTFACMERIAVIDIYKDYKLGGGKTASSVLECNNINIAYR